MTMSQPAAGIPSAGPPELPPQGFLVDFNLVPAKAGDNLTILLRAAYRIPGELQSYYGAKVNYAALIGAIDRKTGAVFVADGSTGHSVPLNMDRFANLPAGAKIKTSVVSSEGSFVIDLPKQLGLPAEGGDFAVVVWIDTIVSKVKLVKVPPNPDLKPQSVVTARPAALSVVEFGKKPKSPKAALGALAVEAGPEEKPFGIGHVYAAVGSNIYPKDAKAPFVTVFASCWLTRESAAQSVLIPAGSTPESGVSLDFELGPMFTGVQDRRKSFAFVVADTQVSPVVTLEPKR